MASSLRRSQDKLLRRAPKDRPVCRTVSVFYEVTSEGREFLSLLRSTHQCALQQQLPQLQFRILHERLNLRWKSAWHQMCIRCACHQPSTTSPSWRPPAVATAFTADPVLDKVDDSNKKKVNRTLLDCHAFLVGFQVYYSTSRSTHHNHFHPLNFNQQRHQCHLPRIMNSQDLPASLASRVSPNQQISLHKSHQTGPSKGRPNLPKTIIQLLFLKNKKAHRPTLTLPPNTWTKLCEWISECLTPKNTHTQNLPKTLTPPPPQKKKKKKKK